MRFGLVGVALVVVSVIAVCPIFASESPAPPPPSSSGRAASALTPSAGDAGENVFVGRYGETVRLAHFWAADASMKDSMEVVNFHLAKQDPLAVVSPPFLPAPKDYVPDNFSRLRLMQMLVVPKDAPGGFESLDKLREGKKKELAAAGGDGKLQSLGVNWPPDSFQILISTPSRLFQLYAQDEKNFFILTSGASPYEESPADPILTNATARLLDSLSTHLDEARLRMIARKGLRSDLRVVLLPGACVAALGLMLLALPKRWGRARLAGGMMLTLVAVGHVIAGSLLFVSWRAGLDRVINEASLSLCAALAMPWICRFISIRMNGRKPWRVFAWVAAVNLVPVLLAYAAMRGFIAGTDAITGSRSFWMMSLMLSLIGLLDGIIFALAHVDHDDNGASSLTLAAALILLISAPARSQNAPIVRVGGIDIQLGHLADSPSTVQWKVLAARNGVNTREELKAVARKNLEDTGRLPFKFHRVEVAGMFSADDTEKNFPDMIDKQLKLSHRDEPVPAERGWRDTLSDIWNKGRDIPEALSDSSGTPTERSRKVIAELKGARIEELFAHSWGTEAVYLGILNGDMYIFSDFGNFLSLN